MNKTIRVIAVAMLALILVLSLASCGGPNPDPEKALASLKENGIVWAAKDDYVIPTALKIANVDGVKTAVSGTGKIDGEWAHVTIVYFNDAAAADAAYESVEDYAAKDKKEDTDWVFAKSGAMIYWGTSAAINAAK